MPMTAPRVDLAGKTGISILRSRSGPRSLALAMVPPRCLRAEAGSGQESVRSAVGGPPGLEPCPPDSKDRVHHERRSMPLHAGGSHLQRRAYKWSIGDRRRWAAMALSVAVEDA
jgi:hypothetical protein